MTKISDISATVLTRAGAWLARRLPARGAIAVALLLTGLCAGLGAWALKNLIRLLSLALTEHLAEDSFNWILFVAPAAGIVLTGLLGRHIFRRRLEHGTERMMADLRSRSYGLALPLVYQPLLACSLTIGSGGSAGSEGPIAYAGGAMGSNIGGMLGLRGPALRMMVICGAAAGIAAIFKAPLGGFFFAVEIMGASLTVMQMFGLMSVCIVAGGTAFALSGFTPDVVWAESTQGFAWGHWWILIPLGVAVGLYSLWYRGSAGATRRMLGRLRHDWVRNLCAGAMLGLCVMVFPALFGEGYGSVEHVLAGDLDSVRRFSQLHRLISEPWVLPLVLGGILLVKGMVVQLTDSGGGVGGTFAPTLFAGCMAGALVSSVLVPAGWPLPAAQTAYLCMAGAMAGITGAPFMAVFITMEITGSPLMLVPLAVVALSSFATVKLARRLGRCHGT